MRLNLIKGAIIVIVIFGIGILLFFVWFSKDPLIFTHDPIIVNNVKVTLMDIDQVRDEFILRACFVIPDPNAWQPHGEILFGEKSITSYKTNIYSRFDGIFEITKCFRMFYLNPDNYQEREISGYRIQYIDYKYPLNMEKDYNLKHLSTLENAYSGIKFDVENDFDGLVVKLVKIPNNLSYKILQEIIMQSNVTQIDGPWLFDY